MLFRPPLVALPPPSVTLRGLYLTLTLTWFAMHVLLPHASTAYSRRVVCWRVMQRTQVLVPCPSPAVGLCVTDTLRAWKSGHMSEDTFFLGGRFAAGQSSVYHTICGLGGELRLQLPSPHLEISHPLQSPPPPRETSLHCFAS